MDHKKKQVKDEQEVEAVEAQEETVADTEDTSEDDAAKQAEDARIAAASEGARWYIIHTYAGHENKVERSLKQRVEAMKFTDRVLSD